MTQIAFQDDSNKLYHLTVSEANEYWESLATKRLISQVFIQEGKHFFHILIRFE